MKFQRPVIFLFLRIILFSTDAKSKTVRIFFWLRVNLERGIEFVVHVGIRVISATKLRKVKLWIHVNVLVEHVDKVVLHNELSEFWEIRQNIIFNLTYRMFIYFVFIVIFLVCLYNSDCPTSYECYYPSSLSENGYCYSGKYINDINLFWMICYCIE